MRKKASIVGGGVIGGGWAARFLLNGWDVRVFDPDPQSERKINEVLANARRALPMLYDCALPAEGSLSFHDSIGEAVAGAEWIQESVPERADLKQKVLREIEAHCAPDALIGSSTSGFRPSQLQTGAVRPGRILVAHPFNPVYLLPLVELVGSVATPPENIERANDILRGLGLFPLQIRAEIDAHVADRLLEAVWRESLWLVRDGIATTAEIDDAIRMGFGLRWAQMGIFETYRIAGGEAGMQHFLHQFGPALEWPWTRLTDVPELTPDLIGLIADQSDAQSGRRSIRELERRRDDNLVALLRALRQRSAAAGRVLLNHEFGLRTSMDDTVPLVTVQRTVPVDWTDYNGHMNEGRYGQVFSDAADAVLAHIGAGADYVADGLSFFTVETAIKYVLETHSAEPILVETRVTLGEGKKLRLWHEMRRARDREILATCDQFLLHVSLKTRKSCDPAPEVLERLEALAARHAS